MEAKEFQRTALDRLDRYLEELVSARERAAKVEALLAADPTLGVEVPDFAAKAWKAMADAGETGRSAEYSPRRDGIGRPVPCATLKVPTGGGKTFLAVHAAAKILDRFFPAEAERFVLWIVPSEAIYSQTKAKLTDREDPFRKLLDIASGGRTRILEKESPLDRRDLPGTLCVMMLMLPSANRKDALEKLRLFKDRGSVNGFLPPEDDLPGHAALKRGTPNLDFVEQGDALGGLDGAHSGIGLEAGTAGVVRSSMGNALRLLRPLVVLDEGHKAFATLSHEAVYGFNPRFVLELSATPKDGAERRANWLVNITGEQLDREHMIKMPIMATVTAGNSWKDCLREAWQQIESLQAEADRLESNARRYIRPILLVQVENTGDRVEGKVHSDDAKAHLMALGVGEDAIAIKTSDMDELKDLAVKDLMDRASPVRAIITMRALQEGWDCPFAYVLCSLAVGRNANAMTQLVGRILRMPGTEKTGVEALDRCYVFAYHTQTGAVVDQVKAGLEDEGMADMAGRIVDTSSGKAKEQTRQRREPFRRRDYYLPQVLAYEGGESARPLDWEADIVGEIPWRTLRLRAPAQGLARGGADGADGAAGGVVEVDMTVVRGGRAERVVEGTSAAEFDPVFATRALMDHVPNPWIARDWAEDYLGDLRAGGWTDTDLAARQRYVLGEMVEAAKRLVDGAAKDVFDQGLASGRIAFHLMAEKWWNNWAVPEESRVAVAGGAKRRRHEDDSDLGRDLFPPTYQSELNGLELEVACFVDRQEAVSWWYRNLVRGNAYGLQGWRRNRIYPDFIIASEKEGGGDRWLVVETKGGHLAGNDDTAYKKAVMDTLSKRYADVPDPLGQLTLFERGAEYGCALVSDAEWRSKLREKLG